MNITEALFKIPLKKRLYFEWKFNIRFDQNREPLTEEKFLKLVGQKSLNSFIRWERSQEYKDLVALYLQSRTANDLQEIYNVVSEKAKTGDEKAVKLFLALTKEIQEHAKNAIKDFNGIDTKDDEEDDDLIV